MITLHSAIGPVVKKITVSLSNMKCSNEYRGLERTLLGKGSNLVSKQKSLRALHGINYCIDGATQSMYQTDMQRASLEGGLDHLTGHATLIEDVEVRNADNKTEEQEWAKEQQKRKQLISKTCQKYNLKFSKQRLKDSFIYDPKHKLLYCQHAKVIKMGCPKTEKSRG